MQITTISKTLNSTLGVENVRRWLSAAQMALKVFIKHHLQIAVFEKISQENVKLGNDLVNCDIHIYFRAWH